MQRIFLIVLALNSSKGGLVKTWHNELHDRVAELTKNTFTSSHMRDNPLIQTSCAIYIVKTHPYSQIRGSFTSPNRPVEAKENPKETGYLIFRYLLQKGMDRIHNMRVVNTDPYSYLQRYLKKGLKMAEKDKKIKYIEECLH